MQRPSQAEIQNRKFQGSKRYILFWGGVWFLVTGVVALEVNNWAYAVLAVLLYLLYRSVGDVRRIVYLGLLVCSIGGGLSWFYWDWRPVAIALVGALLMNRTHHKWVVSPALELFEQFEDSSAQSASDRDFSFAGGDGATPESAVEIHGVETHGLGVAAEYEYLRRELGDRGEDWDLVKQSVIRTDDGRRLDRFVVDTQSGGKKEIYFDISNFFGPS